MRLLVAAAALAAVAALIVLGASAPAAGADVSCAEFASPSGSDGSGDGSLANPYASPQKLADSLAAGQTGCLRAGTYEFSLLSVRSPNITLAPYGSDSATLRGPIKVLPSGAGSTIEGLTLDGVNSNLGCTGTCGGGSPRIYADGVVLRDNEITDEHTGICVMVGSYYSDPPPRGVVIEHNRIHDCGRLPAANHDHGIYVSESRDAVIRDNWIYDNADRGIQLYPDAIGTTITGNVIYGNGEAQNFSCDASSCSKDNVVAGNIIADSVVRWNVYANSQGATPDGSNVLRDNCLYASRSGYTDNGGVDSAPAFYSESANLVANPRFADPSRGDFVLDPASPCLAKYTGTMSLPQGSTGGGGGSGGTGGGSAPAATTTVLNVKATTVGKVKGRGGDRHRPRVEGAVLLQAPGSSTQSSHVRGKVEVKVYRRSAGHWRAISRARKSRLTPGGRFKKLLRVFRGHPLHRGTYRVQAHFRGSRTARPSLSRSLRFTVKR
jgi:parallel beta-helix repeat protein